MGKVGRALRRIEKMIVSAIFVVGILGFMISKIPPQFYMWLGAALGIASFIWIISKIEWRSEKYINERGYVFLRRENEVEHRFIAKQILGRRLRANEIVHHINGNKIDNAVQNLCLMDREKHEHFQSWIFWKKQKTGDYPSSNHQRSVLIGEYGGILLDSIAPGKNEFHGKSSFHQNIVRESPRLSEKQSRQLFNELRKERMRIANKKDVPAYIVFKDFTLREMVEKLPESKAQLNAIIGWNTQAKIDEYGDAFLGVIAKFMAAIRERTGRDSA